MLAPLRVLGLLLRPTSWSLLLDSDEELIASIRKKERKKGSVTESLICRMNLCGLKAE